MQNFPVPKRSFSGFQNFPSPSKLRRGFPDFISAVIKKKIEDFSNWLGTWKYRIPLVLDSSKIDSDLTHFPVPIVLTGTDAEAVITELSGSVSAKSVIFDIADNWGDAYIGVVRIEFYRNSEKIELSETDFTDYGAHYSSADVAHAFNTSLNKTGQTYPDHCWVHNGTTNRRIIVVFNTAVEFDSIVVNNFQNNGVSTARGIKNVKIHTSTDAIADTAYDATISNSELIFDGQFDEHVASDVEDEQILELSIAPPKKIAVGLPDKSQLYCEIEQWDTVNNKITLWVSRSDWVISSAVDTTLFLYYDAAQDDNLDYVGDPGDAAAQNVWNSCFDFVYHMMQDPSGGADCIIDSTINANHGTPEGTMLTEDLVDGQIGKAITFDGSDDSIEADYYGIGGSNSRSFFAWINTSEVTEAALLGYGVNVAIQKLIFRLDTSRKLRIEVSGGGQTSNLQISDSVYSLVGFTFEGTSLSDFTLHKDLSSESLTDGSSVDTHILSNKVKLMASATTTLRNTSGIMDEARFSNIKLSDDWIKADYHAQTNTLLTAGTPQEFGVETSTPVVTEVTAKSVILDIADAWGGAVLNIRSVEFFSNGTLINLIAVTDFSAVGTTYYSSSYLPAFIFDTSLSKTGTRTGNAWHAGGSNSDRRIACVFTAEQTFDTIVVNNCHISGANTDWGAKNVKIYTSSDAITSIVYGEVIANSELIFDGQFTEHVASDVEDDQILDLILPTP